VSTHREQDQRRGVVALHDRIAQRPKTETDAGAIDRCCQAFLKCGGAAAGVVDVLDRHVRHAGRFVNHQTGRLHGSAQQHVGAGARTAQILVHLRQRLGERREQRRHFIGRRRRRHHRLVDLRLDAPLIAADCRERDVVLRRQSGERRWQREQRVVSVPLQLDGERDVRIDRAGGTEVGEHDPHTMTIFSRREDSDHGFCTRRSARHRDHRLSRTVSRRRHAR
jgi:hypothetical protein